MASKPAPFYQDDSVTIYCTFAENILPHIDPKSVALLLADPPYGVAERTDRGERGRGRLAHSYNFDPIAGDDLPFDPTPLLRYPRVILFGANYYAQRLPPSPTWFVWDKLNGLRSASRRVGFCDGADLELAWSNLGGPARLMRHRWMGAMKDSERGERRVHPTQKPVAIMEELILAYTQPGDLVLDPYMGSGPVLLAARQHGRRAIGCELSEDYCRTALERLRAAFPPEAVRA